MDNPIIIIIIITKGIPITTRFLIIIIITVKDNPITNIIIVKEIPITIEFVIIISTIIILIIKKIHIITIEDILIKGYYY